MSLDSTQSNVDVICVSETWFVHDIQGWSKVFSQKKIWRVVPFKENIIFDVHLITFSAVLFFRFDLNPSELVHPE